MLIFLDTEFTDFEDRDLISMAMVSDDGKHEFYAERYDFDGELCSEFVLYEVLPHLGRFPATQCHRDELAHLLWQWFAALPGKAQIAADYLGDRDLLSEALAGNWPDNLDHAIFDLSPLLEDDTFNEAACAYHNEPDHPWHHALHDARANRAGWVAWVSMQDRKTA